MMMYNNIPDEINQNAYFIYNQNNTYNKNLEDDYKNQQNYNSSNMSENLNQYNILKRDK